MSKILIIDDEKGICNEFRVLLEDDGHKVDMANNGLEGIQMVHDHDYDVIFLDVLMPRMEGREVFEKIKQIKDIPIVIMSGFLPANKEKDILALGAIACLRKPLDLKKVHSIIKDVESKLAG
ncbi:MAG: response regulator [Candidatus Omnitrophica bacterium]|nr:response regulator [Candidatus Omnitrophota bacterium]MDD5671381.1 response regulator [Candidatus Omnitrophota bacterium]